MLQGFVDMAILAGSVLKEVGDPGDLSLSLISVWEVAKKVEKRSWRWIGRSISGSTRPWRGPGSIWWS